MTEPRGWTLDVGADLVARVVATDVSDGDLAVGGEPDALARRRRAVVDRPWVWLRQIHGSDVVEVGPDDPIASVAGAPADAVVSTRLDVALAAHSADCATVALIGTGWADSARGPVVAAVHAGWRGLGSGVLDRAVAAVRGAGASEVRAVLGPCIGVECYEFGEDELGRLVERLGPTVAGRTREGRPALDVRLGVRAALGALDVAVVGADLRCTACSTTTPAHPVLHSHRARGDLGRQALVVWLEHPSSGASR